MQYGTGAEGCYALYWTMEKFFMALSRATPASCISYLWIPQSVRISSLFKVFHLNAQVINLWHANSPVTGGDSVVDWQLGGA